MEMILDNLKIHAHIKPANSKKPCLLSDQFRSHFITNNSLPEFIEQIPVHQIPTNDDEPMIMIYDGEKEIALYRSDKINSSDIIDFLMKYMEQQIF